MRSKLSLALAFTLASFSSAALAQPEPEDPPPPDPAPAPAPDPAAPPPAVVTTTQEPPPQVQPEAQPEPMSEGRLLVSLYNSGFQWGIAPGIVFSRGKAGFFLGVRFGYGFDVGPVILVPGIRLAGYFTDPNVYVGMPTFKLVFPIDRFAPFVEGGAGWGHVTEDGPLAPAKSGLALMGGGGFMIHFTRIAFGAEATYQVITDTAFKGFSVGPILAIGF